MSEHHKFIIPREFRLRLLGWPAPASPALGRRLYVGSARRPHPCSAIRNDRGDQDNASWDCPQYYLALGRRYLSFEVRADYNADPRKFALYCWPTMELIPASQSEDVSASSAIPGSDVPERPM